MIKQTQSLAVALLAAGIFSIAQHAAAADTATQTVTFSVSAINELTVSGNPGSLTITTATAGSAPTAVTDSTTSYAITTNETNRKITGSINSNMPGGLTLSVTLAAPAGSGTSAGKQALSTTAVDLVTGISTLNESARTITYELGATTGFGVVPSASKTVTLTIVAGS